MDQKNCTDEKKLEKHFQKYPGVGPRQASRYVFFLLKQPKEYLENFINDLDYLKKQISLCENCNLPKQKQNPYCKICSDEKREKNTIYLVEKEQDAINLESTNIHNGTYFILGENISPMPILSCKRRSKICSACNCCSIILSAKTASFCLFL